MLTLHLHPLSSYCHKVLVALYENATPFEPRMVDLQTPEPRARFLAMWPAGKIPVLRDEGRNRTLPETSIIIEYLDQHYPGKRPLLPEDQDARLEARLWDRIFDLYVHSPMQAIVAEQLRPEHQRDPLNLAKAVQTLETAYGMIERQIADKTWAIGEDFTLADCAAAPALFYADIVVPFSKTHAKTAAYFERLLARPSFARTLVEARPYFQYYPFKDKLPARFLGA